jgi:type IV secretion system protein VirB2
MMRLLLTRTATQARFRIFGGFHSARPAMLGAALAMIPTIADAQTVTGGASPATMVNNICTFILGTFGQSLAVLGIIAIGLAWMFGRASLGLIAGVVGGIIIMFGASYLGETLTGGTAG